MRPLLILLVKFQAVFKHDITWDYVSIINILFRFHYLLPFLIVSIPHKAERRFLWRLCGAEDIGRHRLKTTYDDRFSTIQSCSPVADLGEGPGGKHHTPLSILPSLYTKLRPEGPKIWWGPGNPLISGCGWPNRPPPSECLDPPLSVVFVVVSMIIFQTIYPDTSLLQTEQSCYLIETLGKSSSYSLLEGENPFPIGLAYISTGVIYFSSKEERRDHSISLTLLKGKTPVYPVSYHNRFFFFNSVYCKGTQLSHSRRFSRKLRHNTWRCLLSLTVISTKDNFLVLHWMVLDGNCPF